MEIIIGLTLINQIELKIKQIEKQKMKLMMNYQKELKNKKN